METGALLTHVSAAAAFLAYLVAVALQLSSFCRNRAAWTLACLLLLLHVACAFYHVHQWSHHAAYEATARQTAALTGFNSGSGLWVNYAVIAVWLLDLGWWWAAPASYQSRPRLIGALIHGFLAFVWFNATVVFGHGLIRWVGLTAWLLLILLYFHNRRLPPETDRAG
ncbi:MAG: hypothetical protein U0984_08300 [Prosthecobacter sp.]|nr:hypothetical protein [Prosthecobacter sp.]